MVSYHTAVAAETISIKVIFTQKADMHPLCKLFPNDRNNNYFGFCRKQKKGGDGIWNCVNILPGTRSVLS